MKKRSLSLILVCMMIVSVVVPNATLVKADEVVVTADDLLSELTKAKDIDKTKYTEASYAELNDAIAYAQDIYDNYIDQTDAITNGVLRLQSATDKLVAITKPTAKAKLKAVKLTRTKIKLTWGAVSGATQYNIYRAKSAKGTYTKIASVTTTSFINEKLGEKNSYYYYVKAATTQWNTSYEAPASNTCKINMKTTVSPEDIKLVATRKKLKRGNFTMIMVRLKASCKGKEKDMKKITFKSSKTKVASVKKLYGVGLVKAKRKGKTVISVKITLKSGLTKVLKTTIKVR